MATGIVRPCTSRVEQPSGKVHITGIENWQCLHGDHSVRRSNHVGCYLYLTSYLSFSERDQERCCKCATTIESETEFIKPELTTKKRCNRGNEFWHPLFIVNFTTIFQESINICCYHFVHAKCHVNSANNQDKLLSLLIIIPSNFTSSV